MRVLLPLLLATSLLGLAGCQAGQPPTARSTPRGQPINAAVTPAPPPAPNPDQPPGNAGLRQAPSDPAAQAAMAVEAPKPLEREGYTPVTFAQLSGFVYEADMNGQLTPESRLPEEISKLDKTKVAVSGFLVPIEFKDDKVCAMILVRNQLLCCFGQDPKLNEWIFVHIDPPITSVMDVPVTLFGTLYASADREEDQVVSLYRMQAEAMEPMR